jgi:membrane associated rhomboid family serine protease
MDRLTAWPIVTGALLLLTILISLVAPEPSSQFDFFVLDREQPRSWPWLTTHFLHTDPAHLLWNVLAFGCLGWLGEAEGRVPFVISLCIGIIAVDIWFAFFAHHLRFYCGMSGALNTVLLVTLYLLRRTVAPLWLFTFAAVVAIKLVWESHSGVALLTHTRWPSAVGAHVAGYAAGLVTVAGLAWREQLRKKVRLRSL